MKQAIQEQKGVNEAECPSEISQFMESKEGQKFLGGVRHFLKGTTIVGVEFYPEDEGITTHLLLSEGEYFEFNDEMFRLDTLREQFASVLYGRTAK